jgi:hypothetical protein
MRDEMHDGTISKIIQANSSSSPPLAAAAHLIESSPHCQNTLNIEGKTMSRCGKLVFTALVICSIFSMSHNLFAQAQCGEQSVTIPVPAGSQPIPTDLSDTGAILGLMITPNGTIQTTTGFLFNQGTFTHFRFPGSADTFPRDINKSAVIVGSFDLTAGGPQHAFMVRNGTFSEITLPGFSGAPVSANGINEQGDITGQFTGNGIQQGFLLRNGVLTTISFPGAAGGTFPTSIDNADEVVGFYQLTSEVGAAQHGFMWKNGVFTNIDVPGALSTTPEKINDVGVVAGFYVGTDDDSHGFGLHNGTFSTINESSLGTNIFGLNNFNNVVGSFEIAKGTLLFKGFCSAVF